MKAHKLKTVPRQDSICFNDHKSHELFERTDGQTVESLLVMKALDKILFASGNINECSDNP